MQAALSEEVIEAFNMLREKGLLFRALMKQERGYIPDSDTLFPEYALTTQLPLEEALQTVDKANIINDFSFTKLRYNVCIAYKQSRVPSIDTVLTLFAAELVKGLAIEDIEGMIKEYEQMLIEIGKPAIKPLQEFLATEGKITPKEGSLYPIHQNYEAARRALGNLLRA